MIKDRDLDEVGFVLDFLKADDRICSQIEAAESLEDVFRALEAFDQNEVLGNLADEAEDLEEIADDEDMIELTMFMLTKYPLDMSALLGVNPFKNNGEFAFKF